MVNKMSAVTVRHVTKNHVVILPGMGYSVTLFHLADKNVEAIVSDGNETIRLLVAGPSAGQTMSIQTAESGEVDIRYTEVPNEV